MPFPRGSRKIPKQYVWCKDVCGDSLFEGFVLLYHTHTHIGLCKIAYYEVISTLQMCLKEMRYLIKVNCSIFIEIRREVLASETKNGSCDSAIGLVIIFTIANCITLSQFLPYSFWCKNFAIIVLHCDH